MTNEEAIKLIDDRMCWGRGRWSKHHMPEIDEYWQAGLMAIKALKAQIDKDTNVTSTDMVSRWAANSKICNACGMIDCDQMGKCKKLFTAQPEKRTEERTETHSCDCISRQKVRYKLTALVNELEEIFAHIRERNEDDSVCGLCEYDGAYIGQSGDWCNECPGFDKSDCFKLKDKYRHEWETIDE